MGATPGSDYYSNLAKFATVSSIWRSTINDCPQLWTLMDITVFSDVGLRALAQSKDAPLIVWCDVETAGAVDFEDFWDSLVPHVERWKSLRVSLKNEEEYDELMSMGLLESQRMSGLEELKLSMF